MRISGVNGYGYQSSRVREEVLIARTSDDAAEQVRIAKNSTDKRVLLALSVNRDLTADAVNELYDRDIPYLEKRLNALGYRDKSWLERLF